MEESRLARRKLAESIAEAILNRHWVGVHALGLYGSLAHGDDDDYSDLNLGVVTKEAGAVPLSTIVRRVNGVVVSLQVRSTDDWLEAARTLTPEWPLTANQFLIARPIYDPHGWYPVVRQAHLDRLRTATDLEFAQQARAALLSAIVYARRTRREVVRGSEAVVSYLLVQTALREALVTGLLDRVRFRDRRDALARTGLGRLTLPKIEERLLDLEGQVRARGAPLDATVPELLGPGAAVEEPSPGATAVAP